MDDGYQCQVILLQTGSIMDDSIRSRCTLCTPPARVCKGCGLPQSFESPRHCTVQAPGKLDEIIEQYARFERYWASCADCVPKTLATSCHLKETIICAVEDTLIDSIVYGPEKHDGITSMTLRCLYNVTILISIDLHSWTWIDGMKWKRDRLLCS